MRFRRPQKPLILDYKYVANRICKEIKEGKHNDIWLCAAKDGSYRLYRDYEPILVGCLIYHYSRKNLPTSAELLDIAWYAPRRLKWIYNDKMGRLAYEKELKSTGEYEWICEGGINPHKGFDRRNNNDHERNLPGHK